MRSLAFIATLAVGGMATLFFARPCSGQTVASTPASAPAGKGVIAVLPFAIDFPRANDVDEDYGQKVAFAIETKWRRLDGWEVVDRYSVQDAMAGADLPRGWDADRRKLAAVVRDALGADMVIFGSVSGSGPTKTIRACVAECRGDGPARIVFDKTYTMNYWTDLRFIVEDAVAAVTGEIFYHPSENLAILDVASLEAWKKNPNLVANPEFSMGQENSLSQWEGVIEAFRYHPPWTDQANAPIQDDRKKMILWSPSPDEPMKRVLQFAMNGEIAGMNGLACYSDWMDVKPGHRYRCQIVYASDKPVFFPFIKCYALIQSPNEKEPQRREVYRRQSWKMPSTGGKWKTLTVDFVPSVLPPVQSGRTETYDLKWARLDLYCYGWAGHVWVKSVAVKLVQSPGPGGKVLDPMVPVEANPYPGQVDTRPAK